MRAKYYLVEVTRGETKRKFVMFNAHKPLTNRMCNSRIFSNKVDARLDVSVFDYFGCALTILNDGKPLDRRTKKYRNLVNAYEYFTASCLPYLENLSE